MAAAPDFTKLVPGFDFLQGLVTSAGAGLPSMGQWIAPTLDPAELEKRIDELRTVQFWLEQNARVLGTTIQALEVQRMTLTTLQTMNLPLAEIGESMKIRMQEAAAPAPAPAPTPAAAPEPAPQPATAARAARAKPGPPPAPAPSAGVAVDPLKWWGALTQQFTELAATALKDSAAEAATPGAARAPAAPAAAPRKKAAAAPRRRR